MNIEAMKKLSALEFLALSPAEKSAFAEAMRFEGGTLTLSATVDAEGKKHWPIVDALNAKGMQGTDGGFSVYTSATKGKNDQLGNINSLCLIVPHGRGERDNLFVKLAPGKKANDFVVGKSEVQASLENALKNVKADFAKDVKALEAAIKIANSL
jgi:hypothetical protein